MSQHDIFEMEKEHPYLLIGSVSESSSIDTLQSRMTEKTFSSGPGTLFAECLTNVKDFEVKMRLHGSHLLR